MDDIYEDLENYNEVNIIEELKSENKELKNKLEDYSTAMDKLQKDFDKLSSEYKMLEFNYSSLLKTAQAEIERKTEIIKNLNMEKDLLVINSLKNGYRRRVLNTRNLGVAFPKQNKDYEKPKNQSENVPDKPILNKNDSTKERLEGPKPSGETKESTNKKVNLQIVRSTSSTETNGSRDGSESKENFKQSEEKEKLKQKPVDIKSRRKSVPAERLEENRELDHSTNHRRNPSERAPSDKHVYDKSYDDRYNRTSERTHSSEKYRESSRDGHRRDNKYYDSYKTSDKYDASRRRRYHSPESRHSRHSRDHKDYYRIDYRSRLESPPFDSDYYRHRDHRVSDRVHIRDYDRHRGERHAVKHKIPISEYDEPYSKRSRSDTYDSYKRNEIDERRYEKEYLEHKAIAETFEQLQSQYTSCQSPDFESNDNDAESIKEIMNTAVVQLEDPRISSSHYKLEKVDGKEILSTAINQDVELQVINQSKWGIKKVNMPEDLVSRPSEEQLIKEIFMSFDNPLSSLSIRSATSEDNMSGKLEINQSEGTKTMSDTSENTIIQINTKNLSTQEHSAKNVEHILSKKINIIVQEQGKSLDVIENLHITKDDNKSYKEKVKIDELPSKFTDKMRSENQVESFNDLGFPCTFLNSYKTYNQNTARDLVEGDLELSDETCDNVEYQKEIQNKKDKHGNDKLDTRISFKVDAKSNDTGLGESSETKTRQIELYNDVNKKDKAEKQLKSTKKIKLKKNKHRVVKETSNDAHNTEANKSANKDKPNEIKTKFRDLFGDSTSLITPEDLGIGYAKLQETNPTNYVPIFEDATDGIELQETNKITFENTNKVHSNNNEPIEFSNIEIVKNESKKNNINIIVNPTNEDSSSNNKINLQPIEKEPDVVKTIVISTGMQPTVVTTNPEILPLTAGPVNNEKDAQKSLGILLNALATSTPYKLPQTVPDIVPEGTENSLTSTNSESISTPTIIKTSESSTMIPHRDVPDVRIFVKRRRKILKRPT